MIAFIIESCKVIASEYAFGPLNHVTHRLAVILVRHLVVYRDIVLRVNSRLDIVCNLGDVVANHYLPALGIGKRDLRFSRFFRLILLLPVSGFSFIKLIDLILDLIPVISIVPGQRPGIIFKLIVNVSYMTVYFRLVKVVLLAVLGPQLCAVARNKFSADKVKMFCNLHGCPEYFLYGFRIVSSEIGNSIVIRFETL